MPTESSELLYSAVMRLTGGSELNAAEVEALVSALTDADAALLVRAVLAGKNAIGTYSNVEVDSGAIKSFLVKPDLFVSGSVSSVAASTPTTIATYTVPAGKKLLIDSVSFSGNNVATYSVLIGSSVQMKKRTYFGNFDGIFKFNGSLVANATDVVSIRTTHVRPFVGDFDSNIIGYLLNV